MGFNVTPFYIITTTGKMAGTVNVMIGVPKDLAPTCKCGAKLDDAHKQKCLIYLIKGANEAYLVCDGRSFDKEDYPELFKAVSNTWGTQPGGKFMIPDMRVIK